MEGGSIKERVTRGMRSVHGRRIATLLVLGILVALAVVSVQKSEDFDGYVLVAELMLDGRHPYADAPPGISTWPPVFSFVATPFALLARTSIHLSRAVWLLINLLALLYALGLLVRLVHKRPLAFWPSQEGVPLASVAVVVPLVLAHAAVTGNFFHLQINILIFALTLKALAWDAEDRPVAGGLLLGAVIAIRVMPLVFLPYLLYRRRFKMAAVGAITAALVFVSPVLAWGPERFGDYVSAWRDAVSTGWGSGFMNQSVLAMFDRYLGHGVVPFVTPAEGWMAPSGARAAHVAAWILAGLTALVALGRFRGPLVRGGTRELLEWSVVFAVGALFGPVCWKSYLIVLLLPFTILVALRQTGDAPARRIVRWTLAASVLFIALPTRDLLGRWLATNLEMASVFTIGGLCVIAGAFAVGARAETDE